MLGARWLWFAFLSLPNSLNSRSVSPENIGKVGKARAEAVGGGGPRGRWKAHLRLAR